MLSPKHFLEPSSGSRVRKRFRQKNRLARAQKFHQSLKHDLERNALSIFLHLNEVMAGKIGAGEGVRTLDPDLGKVVLYH
jgi:hypothetical protein